MKSSTQVKYRHLKAHTVFVLGNVSVFLHQSLVPLEPREHAWLVKGAAGAWPDIYSLFREDPSLLNRQDFISGYTALHWIAKHGDHRVLNTLWYVVLEYSWRLVSASCSLCKGLVSNYKAFLRGLFSVSSWTD